MKQLITYDLCRECRRCCKFTKDELYFAPLFTAEDIKAVRETASGNFPDFQSYRGSSNVFQITLQRSKFDDPLFEYVCPFLDEDNYACTIYEQRPFDCRAWPFVVCGGAATDTATIVRAKPNFCKGLASIADEALQNHESEFATEVTHGATRELLRTHPELIWELEPVHLADVIAVQSITGPFSK